MKTTIQFNGEELISKSEAIRMLGFSQLNSVNYYIRRGKLDEYKIIGLNKKLLSQRQVLALRTRPKIADAE
ncbi:MAG: hypothetical protein P8P90_02905 [Opitutales bacterium]|nr:hypothetical protein [Opitutales bacterium]